MIALQVFFFSTECVSVLKIAHCSAMETDSFNSSTFDRKINTIFVQLDTTLSSDLSFVPSYNPTNTLLIPVSS